MTFDDLPFGPPTPDSRNLGAPAPRRCARHQWERRTQSDIQDGVLSYSEWTACSRCNAVRDSERARRGKAARRAGNDAERELARAFPNARRVGQAGGPEDVIVSGLYAIQSKRSGVWFSQRYWDELQKLPRTGGLTPTLVVSDKPGPGRKRRWLVIRELKDEIALHGTDVTAATSEEAA